MMTANHDNGKYDNNGDIIAGRDGKNTQALQTRLCYFFPGLIFWLCTRLLARNHCANNTATCTLLIATSYHCANSHLCAKCANSTVAQVLC